MTVILQKFNSAANLSLQLLWWYFIPHRNNLKLDLKHQILQINNNLYL